RRRAPRPAPATVSGAPPAGTARTARDPRTVHARRTGTYPARPWHRTNKAPGLLVLGDAAGIGGDGEGGRRRLAVGVRRGLGDGDGAARQMTLRVAHDEAPGEDPVSYRHPPGAAGAVRAQRPGEGHRERRLSIVGIGDVGVDTLGDLSGLAAHAVIAGRR